MDWDLLPATCIMHVLRVLETDSDLLPTPFASHQQEGPPILYKPGPAQGFLLLNGAFPATIDDSGVRLWVSIRPEGNEIDVFRHLYWLKLQDLAKTPGAIWFNSTQKYLRSKFNLQNIPRSVINMDELRINVFNFLYQYFYSNDK